ncbi:MAG: DUF692 domain-containing protein [Planctomycetes bacterium]|nr:DUF692 domain-containing protein [Planctomycetota bacterium]
MIAHDRSRPGLSNLGLGIGLRRPHVGEILRTRPNVDFFELLTENHLEPDTRSYEIALRIAERYPVVLHGVSLSIGSHEPLDRRYLARVRRLAERTRARWISDHLCWTGVLGRSTHDLLPLPYDEATLSRVADRAREVSDVLGQPLVLENPSTYLQIRGATMSEEEFLVRLCDRADCLLLVDVNNAYVSTRNHGFDPEAYLDALPSERIVQIHLAGHLDKGSYLLDTHDRPVSDPVWKLFARLTERIGARSTLVEWDADVPSFDEVHQEVLRAKDWMFAGGRCDAVH